MAESQDEILRSGRSDIAKTVFFIRRHIRARTRAQPGLSAADREFDRAFSDQHQFLVHVPVRLVRGLTGCEFRFVHVDQKSRVSRAREDLKEANGTARAHSQIFEPEHSRPQDLGFLP